MKSTLNTTLRTIEEYVREGEGEEATVLTTVLAGEEEETLERLQYLNLNLDVLLLSIDDPALDALLLRQDLQDGEGHGIVGVAPGSGCNR